MLAARPLHTKEAQWGNQPRVNRVEAPNVEVKKRSKERLKWIATILFCTSVLCAMIWQFSKIAEANINVERMKIQLEDQNEKNAKLQDQVSQLSSPTRIISKARAMGMVPTNTGIVANAK
ncbi:hypothetical protein [Effusibacillus dendaii]|uniref:Cell division protein FtsL n=1 Tax=Effusibacillus dendaii TaxID=2743772 RepID=A0A7I8DDW6_9BACL|nr:hypothetical protein [Effusibacillus dendaii]BCJ86081.1 hypothetical protein skT53_10660 [Effusibacillus dendaii]